jgi:hypothetical protein
VVVATAAATDAEAIAHEHGARLDVLTAGADGHAAALRRGVALARAKEVLLLCEGRAPGQAGWLGELLDALHDGADAVHRPGEALVTKRFLPNQKEPFALDVADPEAAWSRRMRERGYTVRACAPTAVA